MNTTCVHVLKKIVFTLLESNSGVLMHLWLYFYSTQIVDGKLEERRGGKAIGTTKKGIGPCYSSKTGRNGLRVGQLRHFESFSKQLRETIELHQRYDIHPMAFIVSMQIKTYPYLPNVEFLARPPPSLSANSNPDPTNRATCEFLDPVYIRLRIIR